MQVISTDKAPVAVGPYSQAIEAGNMLFVSGQLGLNPETGLMVKGGLEAQTHQVFRNLVAILEKAGYTLAQVVRADVFLSDLQNFTPMNEIYASYFGQHKPARQTVEVKIPKDGLIEISIIACKA